MSANQAGTGRSPSLARRRVGTAALVLALFFAAALARVAAAAEKSPEPLKGEIHFTPTDRENTVPEIFRLTDHSFPFEQTMGRTTFSTMECSLVTFPSPVVTPHERNNTVHCEYFRTLREGKRPGVIVLHILGGDFELSRLFCRHLAHHGVGALFVKLPYYGERREPSVSVRMISANPDETVQGMRQAVLDIRRAAAWLGSREEIDGENLGIFGISLGGITGALASAGEPRLQNICLMLAGGDLPKIVLESAEMADVRREWEARGVKAEDVVGPLSALSVIDPLTYGSCVRGRNILMMNARQDEVIPLACTEALWESFGKPPIVWMEAGHYSAARFILDGLSRTTLFFLPEAERTAAVSLTK